MIFFLFFPLYFASKHIYCLYRQNVAVTGATEAAAAVGVATKVAATLALLLLVADYPEYMDNSSSN